MPFSSTDLAASGLLKDNKPTKRVKMALVGLDGNAFSLMGAFQKNARHQGWTQAEINAVLDECKTSDYTHLLGVLVEFTTEEDEPDPANDGSNADAMYAADLPF